MANQLDTPLRERPVDTGPPARSNWRSFGLGLMAPLVTLVALALLTFVTEEPPTALAALVGVAVFVAVVALAGGWRSPAGVTATRVAAAVGGALVAAGTFVGLVLLALVNAFD